MASSFRFDSDAADAKKCATKPAEQIVAGDWADDTADTDWNYDSRTVTRYRTVTTTPYAWNAQTQQWELDTVHAQRVEETVAAGERAMTDAELQACTSSETSHSKIKIKKSHSQLRHNPMPMTEKKRTTLKDITTQKLTLKIA